MNKGKKSTSSTGSKIPASVPRASTSSSAPTSSNSSNSAAGALQTLFKSYGDNTPARLKLIDAFCAFLVVLGVIQFVYCIVITDYPFNSFLAGFSATVGQFVLAASLRIQANKANTKDFNGMTPERAFADFVFGSIVLHFFVYNFLG
ncbi:defender against death DAD protein [Meira miltonrushii]|uniref:Dolichyl-diphosphooligosaccharide--protein glycosyltransferase subunit OST2 n=1 Tax=Meira miltonrushii TaxID=1280837 RepID=A0A316VJF1_9BASI|nr:defender against death DAD protein [Meira miltonrushii]PWN37354.1 defender against death DAD protein [Meira miltonrushii]